MLNKEYFDLSSFGSGRCLRIYKKNESEVLFCSTEKGFILLIDITELKCELLKFYQYDGNIRNIEINDNILFSVSETKTNQIKISKILENGCRLKVLKSYENIKTRMNCSFNNWMAVFSNSSKLIISTMVKKEKSIFLFDFGKDRAWNFSKKEQKTHYSVAVWDFKSFIACFKSINSFDHRSKKLLTQIKVKKAPIYAMICCQKYLLAGQNNCEILLFSNIEKNRPKYIKKFLSIKPVLCFYFKLNTKKVYVGNLSSNLEYIDLEDMNSPVKMEIILSKTV